MTCGECCEDGYSKIERRGDVPPEGGIEVPFPPIESDIGVYFSDIVVDFLIFGTHLLNNLKLISFQLTSVKKKMKVLAIGDQHFKVDNIPEVELFIEKIEKLANTERPDLIVCLGDLLHTHERVHVAPLNKAYEFIDRMRKVAKTYVLVGNHDYIQNQQFLTDNHWLNALKDWENVEVVDRVKYTSLSDYHLVLAPYVPPGRFKEALNTLSEFDWKEADCIFAHQEFYGCKLGAIVSVEGDKWGEDDPYVVSGHIHSKQRINGNIYYTGSSLQVAFGESEENTVAMLEFGEEYPYKLREMDLGLPRKKIVYTDFDSVEKIKLKEDTQLKITLSGNAEEFKTFKKSEKYKELVDGGAKIAFKKTESEISERKATSSGFKNVLEELVNAERDEFLSEAYELVVNGREMKILFL